MKKEQIGENAGIIWKIINDGITDKEIDRVLKESKLKKKEFYMALGWLARENKIDFLTTDDTTCILLTE